MGSSCVHGARQVALLILAGPSHTAGGRLAVTWSRRSAGQLGSAVRGLLSTSRLVWACFHVARVESETERHKERQRERTREFTRLGLRTGILSFHHILMMEETLKTSPKQNSTCFQEKLQHHTGRVWIPGS